MPLPQGIDPSWEMDDLCAFAHRWTIDIRLATRLQNMAWLLPYGLVMISGFRTVAEQVALKEQGRPAADPKVSTHTSCPATGADIRLEGIEPTDATKAAFGAAAQRAGLRWGGGSPVNSAGIPSDWNHLDLGPRTS